ncbi:hypothetical protein T12_8910 [Trichinella patagoniensis]|uniref:Uncharacterized protein n=1 Tax=Trichinella patagoniensis TaxID=990121 RepID=A0A0V0ZL72_9BILA|nr:hypothetical protein T12_8910 [Trichinella patagoniensis]
MKQSAGSELELDHLIFSCYLKLSLNMLFYVTLCTLCVYFCQKTLTWNVYFESISYEDFVKFHVE